MNSNDKDLGVLIPPKELICENLDFDDHERRFYEDLLARGQETIEKMNEKGTLNKNYMNLLTMLLRLRQGVTLLS